MKVTSSGVPGGICAVSSLEFIYDKYGYETLSRTLMLAVGTWEGEPQSLSAGMLKGIAKMVSIYQDELNDDAFKERLSRVSVKEIVRTAKERQAGSRGFVEALLLQYNKKTRYPLLWEKLYDHNNRHRRDPIPEEVQETDVDSDDAEDDEE